MQEKLFIVEGAKTVLEFLASDFLVKEVYGTEDFWHQNENSITHNEAQFDITNENSLKQAGSLSSNNAAIALVRVPELQPITIPQDQWTIVLDHINDPGNLGTIIRIADWYGIKQLIVSENSVDAYNPKTVSASKGSLTRVQISYANLMEVLDSYDGAVLGADMDGVDIHSLESPKGGVLLMGSESHGISPSLDSVLMQRITIPRVGGAESLNVAAATAIICDCLVLR